MVVDVESLKEYRTIANVAGPLIFVEKTHPVGYGELVSITMPDGGKRLGQVLDTSKDMVIVQSFEGTSGIDRTAKVRFLGDVIRLKVSEEMLGRVFDGTGRPVDGKPEIIPKEEADITGSAINPYSRASPDEFIQTGISTIDFMNTLVRGQKLPIFSGSGLPHNDIALQIARQSRVLGHEEKFAVVFAAMGITNEEAKKFIASFEETNSLERVVVFLNLANDPAIERLITPRLALTAAEFLAYKKGMHVLVILTDMTTYCDALREISAAREEIPARRGYPGYMYSVDGSRRVIVKDPEGLVRVIEINKLFNILSSENARISDGFEERINVSDWQALSADNKGNSSFKPIRQIVRHKYNGKLCKITTQMGETIVTPNHSIFTLRNGKIQLCEADKLTDEDLIVHINKIPELQETKSIDDSLAKLAGYYVAEGHATRYLNNKKGRNCWCHYVRIDSNSEEIIDDIVDSYNTSFKASPSVFVSDKRSGTIRTSIGGKIYYDTLVNTLGCNHRSDVKRIPNSLFTAPISAKLAFFNAYYAGDGKSQDPRYKIKQYDMVTISPGLRDDLMLLSRLVFPDRIPTIYKWKGRNAWKVYLSTKLKGKHSVLNDMIGCEVSKIEFVEPTEEYVYDLSVEDNQNFVDACGNVLLHNTDLATIYERAGMIKGNKGSITQLPILTMVGDDITHPIPDLTGYITEGQIVLSREMHRRGIYPPIDVLPSLSRLMNQGIGKNKTREDHRQVSDQLYAFYAEGRDLRSLASIVGEEALSERDKRLLAFAEQFELRFVNQGIREDRSIEQTMQLAWELLSMLPEEDLTRISSEFKAKYYPRKAVQ